MFTFSLHFFTLLYLYRKFLRINAELESQVTYFLFWFCQFFTTFYWTGDYDRYLLFKPKYIYIYIIILIFYVLNFMIMGWIGHKNLFERGVNHNSSSRALNRVQDVVQTFLIKNTYKDFNLYLNDLWYDHQLNHKKLYKDKFVIFMFLISFLLIYLFIYFIYSYIYYFFYSHRTPTIYIVISFERKILYYIIFMLKSLFIYNLMTSYVFNNLTPTWPFLFHSYETNEDFYYPLLETDNLYDILIAYNGTMWYWGREETINIKEHIFERQGKKLFRKKKFQILFKKEYYDNQRYALPKKWRSYKMTELDCIVSYNYFFKFWLWLQNQTRFVHQSDMPLFWARYLEREHGYKVFAKDTWRIISIYYSYSYSYQNKAYKESKNIIKKYNFK